MFWIERIEIMGVLSYNVDTAHKNLGILFQIKAKFPKGDDAKLWV